MIVDNEKVKAAEEDYNAAVDTLKSSIVHTIPSSDQLATTGKTIELPKGTYPNNTSHDSNKVFKNHNHADDPGRW